MRLSAEKHDLRPSIAEGLGALGVIDGQQVLAELIMRLGAIGERSAAGWIEAYSNVVTSNRVGFLAQVIKCIAKREPRPKVLRIVANRDAQGGGRIGESALF